MQTDHLPLRVLQFGGGNFLRGFVDYMLDVYNKETGSCLGVGVVKVTPRGDYNEWKAQDGLFHVRTRGIKGGALVNETDLVSSVSTIFHAYQDWDEFLATARKPDIKYIFSNTTETGFSLSAEDQFLDAPPPSFPAKLCKWLYERYIHFYGSPEAACTIIPCELLESNGELLKELLIECAEYWRLELDFIRWMATANTFCNTLVDRIIPGVSKDKLPEVWQELGCEDQLVTEGEPYHIWVIEGPKEVGENLPLDQVGLNVVFSDDITPYRERKVKILNGSHTALVPVAYLSGLRLVRDTVNDPVMSAFLDRLLEEEILPALDMPDAELKEYAASVIDRFKNPYIDHYLLTISLNSFAKFKVRLLPSLLNYVKRHGKVAPLICFSLACLIRFYKGEYDGQSIALNDEAWVLDRLKNAWEESADLSAVAKNILSWSDHWGQNLSTIPGFQDQVATYLERLEKEPVKEIVEHL